HWATFTGQEEHVRSRPRATLSIEPRSSRRTRRRGTTFSGSQEVLAMKLESAAKVKYGIWGLIAGAAIAMVLGFGWGGWTTSSTANAASAKAVVSSQAAICVAQFVKQPNQEAKLKEFGEVST